MKPRACNDRDARLRNEDDALRHDIRRSFNLRALPELPFKRVTFEARSGRRIMRTATDEKQLARLLRRKNARLL